MGLPPSETGPYPDRTMARILIADDSAPLRLLMTRVLEADGHQVFEAVDGDQALDVLTEHRPDVAILDVVMPGFGGLEVCRAVRADTGLRDMTIVIVSGNDESDAVADAGPTHSS